MAKKIIKFKKKECLFLCNKIYENQLAINTFGNASIFDKENGLIYIKPSGVSQEKLTPDSISTIDIKTDNLLSGLKPSVDYLIHKSIYENFSNYQSIIHTHSTYATILAQLNISPKCIGTTHADYTISSIPVTNEIKLNPNRNNYDHELNLSIYNVLKKQHYNFPFILIKDHGVLIFGESVEQTLDRAIAVEFICKTYYFSLLYTKKNIKIEKKTKEKFMYHDDRKNSKKKFYGQ
tara:strand:- start:5997 stop:6701 length:705 start_codon:yes stop_codon:yes gene_type:complete